jgi:hypothetical protein
MRKEPKYKVIFSSQIKPLTTSEKDKYLALASVEKLRPFIPAVNVEKNYDLLPIAFNACVINRANKNDDVMTSETAVAVYKDFITKQINVEHNRANIIGVILTAGFSEFGTDLPMTEEQALASTKPYNIVCGGVIWRVANYDLADVIEACDDPTSEHYLKISASWELGFDDWDIVVIDEASKNTEDGQLVSDEGAMITMMDNLRCMGGNGRFAEAKRVYRRVKGAGVLPMGIGLTESPAADVKGILSTADDKFTQSSSDLADAIKKVGESTEAAADTLAQITNLAQEESRNAILATLKNFSSQSENQVVKKDSIMKFTSIKDITDDALKTTQATVIQDFIAEELKKASEVYSAEKTEKENAIKAAKDQYDALLTEHNKLKASVESLEAELKKLREEATAREVQASFDARMASFDSSFDLTDEDRKAIASQIKGLSDEAFKTIEANLSTLLSAKKKTAKAAQTVVASTDAAVNTNAQAVVDTAVTNAKPDAAAVTATTDTAKVSLKDKYSKAFGVDGFDIQINNKR